MADLNSVIAEYTRLRNSATHPDVKAALSGLIAQAEASRVAVPPLAPAPVAAAIAQANAQEANAVAEAKVLATTKVLAMANALVNDEEEYEDYVSKPLLTLQLHQEIIVQSISNKIIPLEGPAAAEELPPEELAVKNRYLIGVLPRGGKTYIAGGIINEFERRKQWLTAPMANFDIKPINIMWITATPNETKSQVGEDLIKKFVDFGDFVFISYPFVSDEFENEEIARRSKRHAVIFCSTQLLINPSSTGKAFLQTSITNADMFFFDEAHKTGSGEKTKVQIEKIISGKPTIFLTATYFTTIEEYNIRRENIFIWDYVDVKLTRKLNLISKDLVSLLKDQASYTESLQRLTEENTNFGDNAHTEYFDIRAEQLRYEEWLQEAREEIKYTIDKIKDKNMLIESNEAVINLEKRFGPIVSSILISRFKMGQTAQEMADDYINFPDLNFVSYPMPAELKKMKPIFEEDDSAKLDALVDIVERTLEYITVHSRYAFSRFRFELPTLYNAPSNENLGKINASYFQNEGFQLEAPVDVKFPNTNTILMFVPTGTSKGILKVMTTWAVSLLKNEKFSRYNVACILDDEEKESTIPPELAARIQTLKNLPGKDIKQQIQELEQSLQDQTPKKGLIILAGSKLSTGVSLPSTDVVFILNDDKSEDTIIQKMYRALTPSEGKITTYVVDYNPIRSYSAVYGYTLLSSGETQKFAPFKGKNTRTNLNKQKALVTEGTINELLAETYTWYEVPVDFDVTKPVNFLQRAVNKVQKVKDYFQTTLKDKEFRCVLNKQLLCVLPVAAAEGGRYRRTTLRTTRSKRKTSRGRTKHHIKARN